MRNKMNKVINWGLSSEMNDFCLKTGSGFETHLYPTPLVWAPGVGGGGGGAGRKTLHFGHQSESRDNDVAHPLLVRT